MIHNLQILRAFAALNVVFFHVIGQPGACHRLDCVWWSFRNWGANGVDIFFVISGFVMLYTQLISRKQPFDFIRARLIRIVPIYWFITTLFLLFLVFFSSAFRGNPEAPIWAVSSYLFSASYISGKHPLIEVGWTLEWEMLFYLVFSVALFLKSWRQIGFCVVALLSMVAVFSGNLIVLEFLFGMLVAFIYHKGYLSPRFGFAVFLIGAAALLLTLFPYFYGMNLNRVLVWGVPSLFIVLGAVFSLQISSPTLTYLGNASYSIYLVQALTIPFFYRVSEKLLQNRSGDSLVLICFVATVAMGCLMYSFVEKPITIRLRKFAEA